MQHHGWSRSCAALALLLACAACAPALNWRRVPVPEPDLALWLPCRPDRASRTVELAGRRLELSMVGCAANGQMFALSWVQVPAGVPPATLLQHWQRATAQHLQLAPQAFEQARPFAPAGALPMPEGVQITAVGQDGQGAALQVDAAWLLRQRAGQTLAVHALVLAPRRDSAAVETFLSGLELQ